MNVGDHRFYTEGEMEDAVRRMLMANGESSWSTERGAMLSYHPLSSVSSSARSRSTVAIADCRKKVW
jgi:hypothetical protein